MRWAYGVVVLITLALVGCGCGLKKPQTGKVETDLASAKRIDSAFAAAVHDADARSIGVPTLDARGWQVDDLVFDVAGTGADWTAVSRLAILGRDEESRLMLAREAIALAGQSDNPFAVASGNGARPVRFRAVGTGHVLEITNLDIADVLWSWRLKNGQYIDRVSAEARRDEVRQQADMLRESITVVAEVDTTGDITQAFTESPFAPIAGMSEAAMADDVFDAVEHLDSLPALSTDYVRDVRTTVSARELRKSVGALLAAAGSPRGAAKPAGAQTE